MFVDLPNAEAREEILATHMRHLKVEAGVSAKTFAQDPRCEE